MIDPKIIDDLAKRLSDSVPEGLRNLQTEAEKNFKTVLQSALGRMDLVTREEFDVQAAVLRRTRDKLEKMEAQLKQLEHSIGDRISGS